MFSSMDAGKILLVEDDLFLRDMYVQVLKSQGFTVLTADDGEAGLSLGQNNTDAKLMLLDIMLPKLHGIEVLKQLKANPATKNLPVAMLTNLTEENVMKEALSLGAVAYLIKVRFTPPEIINKVKELIAGKAQQA
jgi:DNA-binding response OmpR family regulator